MTPPDDAPQTGQRVWRWPRTHNRPGHDYRDFYVDGDEPGVWHSLDPKALASVRDEAAARINARWVQGAPPFWEVGFNVAMEVLGLTPPEPKEGGA